MKKKVIIAMFALSALVSLGGCKKVLEFEQESSVQESSEVNTASEAESTSEESTSEESEESKETETEESKEVEENEESKETEEDNVQTTVKNNGSFFVQIDDKIYYRGFGESAFNANILGNTNFMNGSCAYNTNTIYAVSAADPFGEAKPVIEKDNGYGPLYVDGQYIYSCQTDENFNESVYRVSLKTQKVEKVCDGTILGASPDGKTICVEKTDMSTANLKVTTHLYRNGKEITMRDMTFPTIGVHYIGMNNNSAFFYLYDMEDATSAIVQLTEDGKYFVLSEIPTFGADELFNPVVADSTVDDKALKIKLELRAGSGHFLYEVREIEVPVCTDFNASETDILYEATVSENLYNEEYFEEQDYPDAIAELETKLDELPDSGFYRTLQKVEEIDGKYYAIVANSVSNSLEAIGWRESYDLLNVEYYCYSEIEGAKKILDCPCLDGTVTMQTWVVGEKGKKANALVYRRCNIESIESEPKLAEFFYTAKLAEDLVYEHPANGDINGDWTKDGVDAFLKDTAGAADGEFLASAPDRDEMGGLKMPGDGKSQLYYHVGFNDEGEINYIRPVVFD